MRAYVFSILLMLSIVAGGVLGYFWGEQALILKPIGDMFLNLLFCIITPLIFFSIASAIANMPNEQRLGKIMSRLSLVFLGKSLLAALFMYGVVLLWPLGTEFNLALGFTETISADSLNMGQQLVKLVTVSDFVDLLSRKNMLALIIIAGLLGFATAALGAEVAVFRDMLKGGAAVCTKVIDYLMYLAPLGLGTYFAALMGEFGDGLISNYIQALTVYCGGALVYFLGGFTLLAACASPQQGWKRFWQVALPPAATALGTCSSAAAIPANLAACAKLGVPSDIRQLALPLGASFHKDGSVLGGVVKIAFLFGIFDLSLTTPGAFFACIGVAILCGTVMGAIPGGGMIGESLILSAFGLPMEALPLIVVIGTLIDPVATVLNSMGNIIVAMLTARWVEGAGWMDAAVKLD